MGGGLFGVDIYQEIQKTYAPTYAPTITEPYAFYSPTITKVYQPTISSQLDYVYAPSIQIESPYAQAPVIETKKEAMLKPSVDVAPTFAPTVAPTVAPIISPEQTMDTGGGLLIPLLIVGAVGIGAYLLLKKPKKKKIKKS